ncbi:SapC family protein [Ramlibacter albus]|uniref:SapC family protein n=1 Tax=Ramlibacter albus TaxID=2079448 RepID=A0A923M6K0_9BURK|nr:SapC family protein [Ramlibacter albus]MBC5764731.1 SapC family protein [Ramlibacter albus]
MNADFHAVTRERHAQRSWRKFSSYQWAAGANLVPIVAPELATAAMHLPIGFVHKEGEPPLTVAVLGFEPGVNLFVAADGRWLGGYVPAMLRMRPFALLPAPDGKLVLCVDEAAGEVRELPGAPGTEPFFTPEGELAPAVKQVMEFVSRVEDNKAPTAAAAAALKEHGLLVPWKITLQTDAGPREVEGLLKVEEAKIAGLPDEAFLALRRAHALPLLYAHLLSSQNMPLLGQLARARAAALKQQNVMPVTANGELDLSFMNGGDTLRFS